MRDPARTGENSDSSVAAQRPRAAMRVSPRPSTPTTGRTGQARTAPEQRADRPDEQDTIADHRTSRSPRSNWMAAFSTRTGTGRATQLVRAVDAILVCTGPHHRAPLSTTKANASTHRPATTHLPAPRDANSANEAPPATPPLPRTTHEPAGTVGPHRYRLHQDSNTTPRIGSSSGSGAADAAMEPCRAACSSPWTRTTCCYLPGSCWPGAEVTSSQSARRHADPEHASQLFTEHVRFCQLL